MPIDSLTHAFIFHFRGCQSILSPTLFWKEDGMMCERAYQQVTGVYCPTEQHAASGLREALLPFHETFERLKGR